MRSDTITIVVIEDEKNAREHLIERLNEEEDITVVGSAASVESAFLAIQEHEPDGIFLDIQLKGGDAFTLINRLLQDQIKIPPIILNTGFTQIEYAQKAFNKYKNYIVEIWLKPFYEGWDDKIAKAKYHITSKKSPFPNKKINPQSKYVVKSGTDIIMLHYNDIKYIESSGEMSKQRKSILFLYPRTEHIISKTLKQIEEEITPMGFLRISRNHIINTAHIKRYDIQEQTLHLEHCDKVFAVGLSYLPNLKVYFELS